MIIKSTPGDGILPHRENIFAIHKKNRVLRKLDELDATYAGGYPMALFAAPRWKTNPRQLRDGYYVDIDVYPEDQAELERILLFIVDEFNAPGETKAVHSTDNAFSYTIRSAAGDTRIQVMRRPDRFGTPESVVRGFDFLNCAMAIKPGEEAVYFHKDFVTHHSNGELQILNPWMLEDVSQHRDALIMTQLLRFRKYCDRWGYVLSEDSLNCLLEVYNDHPQLVVKKSHEYMIGSGARKTIAPTGANIWNVLAEHMTSSPYWKPEMDKHGVITDNPQETESPLPDNEWEVFDNTVKTIFTDPPPVPKVWTRQEVDDAVYGFTQNTQTDEDIPF